METNAPVFTGQFTPAGEAIYSTDALRKHVDNAAIAAQLTPPTDAQFLDKCERVAVSRAKLRRENC